MTVFKSIEIDSTRGNINDNNRNTPFRRIDDALKVAEDGDNLEIFPGIYDGIDLIAKRKPFSFQIEGKSCSSVTIEKISHTGYINSKFKSVKLKDLNFELIGTTTTFDDDIFVGGHILYCSNFSSSCENPLNEINFNDCSFGVNFQITVTSGLYSFSFKNCTFSSKSIPIIVGKGGIIDIKATMCNFDTPIIVNEKSTVNIHYTCCTFSKDICIGNECVVFTNDLAPSLSALRTYSYRRSDYSNSSERSPLNIINENIINDLEYKAIHVDTNEAENLILENLTEFILVDGENPLTVTLPNTENLSNGHCIEFSSRVPYMTINKEMYFERNIKIRYIKSLPEKWHFTF